MIDLTISHNLLFSEWGLACSKRMNRLLLTSWIWHVKETEREESKDDFWGLLFEQLSVWWWHSLSLEKEDKYVGVKINLTRSLLGYVVKEAGYLLSGSQEKEMRCYIDLRLYMLIEHIDFN